MSNVNDDTSPGSETWLDRRLDKADEEIWKWILIGLVGSLGLLLSEILPPKVLGVSTAALFALWLIAFLRVRRLKKRLASLGRKTAPPAAVSPAHIPPPSRSDEMSDHAYSILCMIYDAHNEGRRHRIGDFQKRLGLKLTEAQLAVNYLTREKYVFQDDDDRLDFDPDEFHLLDKGASYVASRRK